MRSKITPEIAAEIKKRHNLGEAIIEISRTMGISYTICRSIIRDVYHNSEIITNSEFFDFNNRCVITGFVNYRERENQ